MLPWLASRGAAVRDPPSILPPAGREDDSENMALLLAAVENLTDAIQNTGVRGDDERKKIKAVILIQVLDLMRQYFSSVVPETSDTTEQPATTAGPSLSTTASTPCVTTSTPRVITSTPCVTASTPSGYRHRRRRPLSNDLPAFGAEVQPGLDDLFQEFQDETGIRMEF